jgi:hypothetical protein
MPPTRHTTALLAATLTLTTRAELQAQAEVASLGD